MLDRLSTIDVITLDISVTTGAAGERARRLLENRFMIAPQNLPHLLIATHNEEEQRIAPHIIDQFAPLVQTSHIMEQKSRNETASNAMKWHRQFWPDVSDQDRKGRILMLGRRGGSGKPEFIKPFVGGAGTTCGAWTPIVAYQQGKKQWIAGTRSQEEERQATPIRGFLRGNYAQGVCPADCSFCYLRGLQGMGINYVEYEVPVSYQQFAVA